MPITTQCTHCGKAYRVADALAGQNVKCKACGQAFVVAEATAATPHPAAASPAPASHAAPPPPPPTPAPAPAPAWQPMYAEKPPEKSSGSLQWALWVGGGAIAFVLVVVLGCSGLWYAFSGPSGGSSSPPKPAPRPAQPVAQGGPVEIITVTPPADRVPPSQPIRQTPTAPPVQPPPTRNVTTPPPPPPPPRVSSGGSGESLLVDPRTVPPKPTLWDVKPDAGEAYPKIKPNLKLSVPFRDRQVIASARPGRFLITNGGSFNDAGFEIWDLQEGRKTRGVTKALDLERVIISPDGAYLAGTRRHGNRENPAGIHVYSLKTGEVVQRIEADGGSSAWDMAPMVFVGEELVALSAPHQGRGRMLTLDIKSGTIKADLANVANYVHEPEVAHSASGRLVAYVDREGLVVLDLIEGVTVGKVGLPEFSPEDAAEMHQRVSRNDLKALAFSHDGTTLAAIFLGRSPKGRLILWNMKDGSVKLDKMYERPEGYVLASYNNRQKLQWTPDGKALFAFNETLIDAATLKASAPLPARPNLMWTHVAGDETVLMAYKTTQGHMIIEAVKVRDAAPEPAATAPAAVR